MCSALFPDKHAFVEHSTQLIDNMYQCCKCLKKFKDVGPLYQHFDTHTPVDDQQETISLNYEDSEEIVVEAAGNGTNELMYVLDGNNDIDCENEVIIAGDQPTVGSVIGKSVRETLKIVNIEHGYVVNRFDPDEDGYEESKDDVPLPSGPEHIVSSVPESINLSNSTGVTRPRNPQPKKRHDVPDFSATNYLYVEANSEIEIDHYKCLRCEQLFINRYGFFRHIEKGKCYINNCDVCSDTFVSNSDFYDHYVASHQDRAICNFCFRTFMYEKNVKEHMLRHLDQFRHRCEECNKGFYTVREYRNHYKNRHMGIRHKCEVCGRSFADEYYFKRHMATHAKAGNTKVEVYSINQEEEPN